MPPLPGGGGFLGRVAQWVVNELVVDNLANNPSFQRFAVRTAKAVEEVAEHGQRARGQLVEQFSDLSASLRAEVERAMQEAQQQGRHGKR